MENNRPLIIGITGASGSIYAFELLRYLLNCNFNIHLVFSDSGLAVTNSELTLNLTNDINTNKNSILSKLNLNNKKEFLTIHNNANLFSSISSGSFETQGMIIVPCSMNTLAHIKSGITSSLITRAADVCLKQGKKLVLVPREMPFNTIHLENMHYLSSLGVKIAVPCPAFYYNPQNINDMINFVVGKILDTFEVSNDLYKRWE